VRERRCEHRHPKHGWRCEYRFEHDGKHGAETDRYEHTQWENIPWGHKLTITIYVEGKRPTSKAAIAATEAAHTVLDEHGCLVDFAGGEIDKVTVRPTEQEGS
jgi:hypothetical protein